MRFKGGPLKRAAFIAGGAAITLTGFVCLALPLPMTPGMPFFAVGFPMLMKAYPPSRLGLSYLREKVKPLDALLKMSHKLADWKHIRDWGLVKDFKNCIKFSDPKLIRRFRSLKESLNAAKENTVADPKISNEANGAFSEGASPKIPANDRSIYLGKVPPTILEHTDTSSQGNNGKDHVLSGAFSASNFEPSNDRHPQEPEKMLDDRLNGSGSDDIPKVDAYITAQSNAVLKRFEGP